MLRPPGGETRSREQEIRVRAAAQAKLMTEHEFFSHVTAAVLWDLPLPAGILSHDSLDVAVFSPRRNPRGEGIRGHEVKPGLAHVRVHPATGFRLASPASVWAMLGALIWDPYDLVAAADAIVREPRHPEHPPALATPEELAAAVSAGRRVGVVALREALPRVRTGAASRTESWTRLTLVDGGLPEPELNWDVCDDRGRFIARVDLAYPALKVAVEYEGMHHLLDSEQWARDVLRYDALAEAGWRVIRVTKHELFEDPAALVARVRRALALAAA